MAVLVEMVLKDGMRGQVIEDTTQTAGFVAADLRYQGPDSIPAGSTHLHLVNEGSDAHHIQVVKLTDEKSADDLLAALEQSAVWPEWAPTYGGPNAVIPGESSNALVHLDAGEYVLICFVTDPDTGALHFMQGMIQDFVVE